MTKAVTVRHFHSLSGERQDIFESAAPLSDMAVPKALPITASELEERSGATLQRPICKQNHWETFPTRHHLAATHTCLLYSLAIAVFFFFFFFPLFIGALLSAHPHVASCKTATEKCCKLKESPSGNQSSG